jgi:hypothetical protein
MTLYGATIGKIRGIEIEAVTNQITMTKEESSKGVPLAGTMA